MFGQHRTELAVGSDDGGEDLVSETGDLWGRKGGGRMDGCFSDIWKGQGERGQRNKKRQEHILIHIFAVSPSLQGHGA